MPFADWLIAHQDTIAGAFVVAGIHTYFDDKSQLTLLYFLAASSADTWLQWMVISLFFMVFVMMRGFHELFR